MNRQSLDEEEQEEEEEEASSFLSAHALSRSHQTTPSSGSKAALGRPPSPPLHLLAFRLCTTIWSKLLLHFPAPDLRHDKKAHSQRDDLGYVVESELLLLVHSCALKVASCELATTP
ncbi:hypothetical protein AC579_9687 [Pseudocercospora musae]|uniref:Uncharacterized protein n=1 Tax=Pseudocercospora musae TaxID=113226 RepID=A0A139GUI4_9PEZI|nr:hypothetical protein AC579_9687 [Pseudocercospora musae]